MSIRINKEPENKTTIEPQSINVNSNITNEPKRVDLNMLVDRCYAIDEETYACVSFNLSTRQGLEFANKTKDLIKLNEIPTGIECHKILENKEGTIQSASVCTTNKSNIKSASDQMFKTFIPTILSDI